MSTANALQSQKLSQGSSPKNYPRGFDLPRHVATSTREKAPSIEGHQKRRTTKSKTVSYNQHQQIRNHHAGNAACSYAAPATSTSRSSTGQQAHPPEPQDHVFVQHPSDALGVVATPRGDPQKIWQATVRHLAASKASAKSKIYKPALTEGCGSGPRWMYENVTCNEE